MMIRDLRNLLQTNSTFGPVDMVNISTSHIHDMIIELTRNKKWLTPFIKCHSKMCLALGSTSTKPAVTGLMVNQTLERNNSTKALNNLTDHNLCLQKDHQPSAGSSLVPMMVIMCIMIMCILVRDHRNINQIKKLGQSSIHNMGEVPITVTILINLRHIWGLSSTYEVGFQATTLAVSHASMVYNIR